MAKAKPILQVKDLQTHFFTDDGVVRAVDGVSFHIGRGETLAVVGESGSGKSVTSLSVMRLLEAHGRIVGGSVLFEGEDLTKMSEEEVRQVRGNKISMIFQEPMTSLNPVYTVGEQIAESIRIHQKTRAQVAFRRAIEMLDRVGISEPGKRAQSYPHQMSGGMRQRVMIAMALSCNPKLLIADEPTTALDVTIQAQILELMQQLQRDAGMSILFITHDLGIVAEIADRVVVMYAGRAVEEGNVVDVFTRPLMPYTAGLIRSIPRIDPTAVHRERLVAIPGNVPNPFALPQGCSFAPRCSFAQERCQAAVPALEDTGNDRMVRCVRWNELDLREKKISA